MLEHYEALLTLYGRHNGVRIARKHLGWYARGIHGAADFLARMNGDDDPARVVAMFRALFAPVHDGALESAPVPEREDRKSTRLSSSHKSASRMPVSARKNIHQHVPTTTQTHQ